VAESPVSDINQNIDIGYWQLAVDLTQNTKIKSNNIPHGRAMRGP